MDKPAILGGCPALSEALPPYPSIGEAELAAVSRVVQSGCLSGFYGSWGDQFYGGPVVKEFEQAWAKRFGVPHVISVNSATSGLFAAMGAIGVGPGDEVIVPPTTMSATAMAPLVYGAIPVFSDIEDQTFCLDPAAVERAITPRTKAILVVNLFGHPAPLARLRKLADERGLFLIEDNAQGPLAAEDGHYAGTIGHIGVFSLNYHKHIHTGEGGMCATRDERLAQRLAMIRNHAENMVEPAQVTDLANLVGFNYRLTEMSAAVGLVQLRNVEEHVARREKLALTLTQALDGLEGLTVPKPRAGCRHVYYVWALRVDESALGMSRARFSEALDAEGFPHGCGYVRPLYLLPIFQKRIGYGSTGFPFNMTSVVYKKGQCPVAERLHEKEFVTFEPCAYDVSHEHSERLINAIRKVHTHRREIALRKP
jgi:dTDP-4-amino-4,6-dideoxygalactose transaminase